MRPRWVPIGTYYVTSMLVAELRYAPCPFVTMHAITWWPTFVTVLIAAISDIRSRRIPNWLVVVSTGSALTTAALTHGASRRERQRARCVCSVRATLGLLYLLGGMGMGDVKLCVAVGAWIGPGQLVMALVMMGLAGGVIAAGLGSGGRLP